jgi:hypothetical protein
VSFLRLPATVVMTAATALPGCIPALLGTPEVARRAGTVVFAPARTSPASAPATAR